MTKYNINLKLFSHVIYTYQKKPYPNPVKNILLYGTWNNADVNQYKDSS